MTAPLLQVTDLRTYFFTDQGVARAVDGVSFSVTPGETVALVGESGCGKTVTSLSILGLVPDPPGRILDGSSIRLRGEELVGASEERLRRLRGNEVAMIFQEPMASLNPVFTVGEQISEPLRLHLGMSKRAARERAVALLNEVGIPEPAHRFDEYPHQLSGGMRQRLALLRTFLMPRSTLLLDEPLGALDALTRREMQEWLENVGQSDRRTVLLVTHDIEEALLLSDVVYVMSPRPGHIVARIDVNLARPRRTSDIISPGFVELKERVLEALHMRP